jgi:hypothetical protein
MSAARSPDTASPIYPERSIRPLPKSRLKSRLSPEQASHIVYPPEPPPVSPSVVSFSHEAANGVPTPSRITNGNVHRHHHHREDTPVHNHCTCGEDGDSGDDEIEFDHPDYRYPPQPANGTLTTGQGKVLDSVQRRLMEAAHISAKPPPPGSAASSADGYESFENTSNKKKRKIPLSGTSSMHQSQLSAGMASMGISGGVDGADEGRLGGAVQQSHSHTPATSTGSGTGISGAGRGRYGRSHVRHDMRRPLGSSNMNSVNGYGSRMPTRHVSAGNCTLNPFRRPFRSLTKYFSTYRRRH